MRNSCDLTLTIYNLNNSGEQVWQAPDNQSIELINLCSIVEEVDLSLDTMIYTAGCEFGPPNWDDPTPYWIPELQLTNQGDIPITEWCVKFQVLGQSNDTVCFNNITIPPGETYIQDWPDIYDWNVTVSIHILHVNGESGNSWYEWGFDDVISNNSQVYGVLYNDECEPEEILGCTDETANNYNPNANVDDGSCTYDVFGCTDVSANNFNPLANIDDGSCTYGCVGLYLILVHSISTRSPILMTVLVNMMFLDVPIRLHLIITHSLLVDDGSCIAAIEGCTDPLATNYNPEANM